MTKDHFNTSASDMKSETTFYQQGNMTKTSHLYIYPMNEDILQVPSPTSSNDSQTQSRQKVSSPLVSKTEFNASKYAGKYASKYASRYASMPRQRV